MSSSTKSKIKQLILKIIKQIPILNILAKKIYAYRKTVTFLLKENENLKSEVNSMSVELNKLRLSKAEESNEMFREILRDYVHRLIKLEFQPLIKSHKPKKKIKKLDSVLQVNTLDNIGGAAKVAHRIHEYLKSKTKITSKMLVAVKTVDDSSIDLLKLDTSKNQQYLNLYLGRNDYDDLLNLSGFEIKNTTAFKNADVVHLHNTYGRYFSLYDLPHLTSVKPFVKTLHDMLFLLGKWDRYLQVGDYDAKSQEFPYLNPEFEGLEVSERENLKLKKEIMKYSDMIIVSPSQWLIGYIKKSILQDKDIRLIHNGIDETIYLNQNKEQARKELGLPLDKKILLFQAHSGKDNIWKGGSYLEEAFKIINAKRKDVLFLNIGGESGSKRGQWQDIPYIKEESKMALYYSASDLFIYPSLADILPLTVLEALSCGTPVVSFRTGGIPEAVEHMQNGYIANYKDLDDFVNGIETFLKDDTLLAKASLNARETIEQKFTIDMMSKKYINLYEEAISNFNSRI